MRCPECAYINSSTSIAEVKQGSVGMASVSGLLTGLAGAYVLAFLSFVHPLLTILTAPLYGRLVADSVTSFSEDCKSPTAEAVGVGSILLGSFVAFGFPSRSQHLSHVAMPELSQAMIGLAVGLAVAVCYHRLKPRPS